MSTKRVKSPATGPSLVGQLRFNEGTCSDKRGESGFDYFGGDSALLGDIGSDRAPVDPFRPIYIFNADFKGAAWVSFGTLPQFSIAAPGVPGVDRVGGVVTVTTTVPHEYSVGQVVELVGVANASFNNAFTITSVPSPTTFTFAQALADAASGNGTVGMPIPGAGEGIFLPIYGGITLSSGPNTYVAASGSHVYAYQAADHVLPDGD